MGLLHEGHVYAYEYPDEIPDKNAHNFRKPCLWQCLHCLVPLLLKYENDDKDENQLTVSVIPNVTKLKNCF